MRVTQRSVRRNYLSSLNRNAKQLADSTQKMNSGRKFSRISENVSDGSRAFKLRRQIASNEQYLSNIEDMRNELKVAENGILDITSILRNIEERMIQGMNTGTMSQTERTIIGDEIDNLKNNIVQIANSQNIDKYTFGGNDNVTPFVKNSSGEWEFQGKSLNLNNREDYQLTDRYLDIGFGLNFKANGDIDEASVSKLSTTGIDVLGFGEKDGMPNNLIVLVEKIAKDFKDGNIGEFQKNLGHIQERRNNLLIQVGDIGNRAKFLEDNENRIGSELIDLKSTQIDIEAVSIEEESVYNNSYLMAWQVSLKLASSILPQSIFDFMR